MELAALITALLVVVVAVRSAQGRMSQRVAWLVALLAAAMLVLVMGWQVVPFSVLVPAEVNGLLGVWLLLAVLGGLSFHVVAQLLATVLVGRGLWPEPGSPVHRAVAALRGGELKPREVVQEVQRLYLVPARVVLALLRDE